MPDTKSKTGGYVDGVSYCRCGVQAGRFVARRGEHRGRTFLKCANIGDHDCRFFRWEEEEPTKRDASRAEDQPASKVFSSPLDPNSRAPSAITGQRIDLELNWRDADELASDFVSLITRQDLLGPFISAALGSEKSYENFIIDYRAMLNQYCLDLLKYSFFDYQRLAASMLSHRIANIISLTMCHSLEIIDGSSLALSLNRISKEIEEERLLEHAEGKERMRENDRTKSQGIFTSSIKGVSEKRALSPKVWNFLTSGIAFGTFRLAFRRMIGQAPMELVCQEVLCGIHSTHTVSASFRVHWNIREYIKQELDVTQKLTLVFTVSGGVRDAVAMTCASYIGWLWPHSNFDLLEAIDSVLKYGSYGSNKTALSIEEVRPDKTASYCNFHVTMKGTKEDVIFLAQQLVWLSAVFRTSNLNSLTLSHVNFMSVHEGIYEIRPGVLEELTPVSQICWYPLLGKCSIASGFPIPDRQGEIGLEVPFQALIATSRVSSSMVYDGRVAMYGFASLLFPTSQTIVQTADGDTKTSVQWHLVVSNNFRSELQHGDFLAEAQGDWLRVSDEDSLIQARSFVGYCRKASIMAGTEAVNYGDISDSRLEEDTGVPGVKLKSLTMGTSGLGFFGVQAGLDIVFSRGISFSAPIDSYDDILKATRKKSILIYDANTQRGWLLPAQRVLLHLIQTWIMDERLNIRLPYVRPDSEATTIENIFIEQHRLVLKTLLDNDQTFYLRDLVKRIWADISGCRAAQKLRRDEGSGTLRSPSFTLRGWEFTDLITRPEEFCMKKIDLGISGCGWEALAEDKNMIVLVSQGLGDLIKPAPAMKICEQLSSVPCGNKLLAASLSCLEPWVDQTGEQKACMQLTNGLFWQPSTPDLLEDCVHHDSGECQKRREIYQRLISTPTSEPATIYQFPLDGAVIFGRNGVSRGQRAAPITRGDSVEILEKKRKFWNPFKS
ncbi:hypothetical protein MMC17_007380 [Xylographa soralifera]|nr:hypothetical protein [Xylographa soralifera]